MTRKLGGKFDPSLTYDRAIFLATHSSYEAERNPSLRLTHGSAVRIMCRMRAQGLTLERLRSMTPVEVAGMLARRRQATPDAGQGEGGRSLYLEPDFADLTGRLIRSMDHSGGTTSAKLRLQRKILYEDAYLSRENRERCAREGLRPYSLSHFYKLWRRFEGSRVAPSFRRHYTPGGVAEFDFTGVTMTASSGQRATFAVLVLNYSRKVYVEAIASQGTEDSARAIVNGFHSFGGVTEVLRVDNYAAAVRGPGKYNGEFTDAYRMLAARLGVSLSSMPPRRPGLKGAAEAAVKIATHVLIARMRERERQGQPFASLGEMNAWLREHMDLINGARVRGVGLTRNELFEGTERAALHGVDSWAISLGGIVSMTLGRTSRVEINGHEYALPPELIGRRIQAEQREGIVVFLDHGRPVCTYRRQDGVPGLSTKPGYTPAEHLFIEVLKATPTPMLLEWAQAIGPNTLRRATSLLHNRRNIDDLRRCVKFLGLPRGNPDLYPVFESFLATLRPDTGISRVAQLWSAHPKPDTTRQDPAYTFQRLHSMVEARLLGGQDPLGWRPAPGGDGSGQRCKGTVFLNHEPPVDGTGPQGQIDDTGPGRIVNGSPGRIADGSPGRIADGSPERIADEGPGRIAAKEHDLISASAGAAGAGKGRKAK